ncbi:MAG: glycosyltransferase family 4 protein [Pirellulaceae bacterium]|jgi:alpha-1,2-rhamnosyltransferase|nr:glycosyltransferase family 4 protein [Pirellulaceae bacterium]
MSNSAAPGPTRIRRILLECTDTYFSHWTTGIQRVVRNVAAQSTRLSQELGVEIKPIVRIGERYLTLPWRPYACRPESWWTRHVAPYWPGRDTWDRYLLTRLLRRVGVRVRKLLYPRTLVRYLVHLRWSLRGETVVPGEGDTFVLLDAWWNRSVWPAVAQARHRGATIGVVMYDLLPVTNPEFFKANVKEPFAASLQIALEQGDYFVAISRAVRDALRTYAADQRLPHRRRETAFRYFRLGSSLDMIHLQGTVREVVRRACPPDAAEAPYLTVGTIEPRKNHVLLLDAFDQIWSRYPLARLCIVGRVGWMCEELVRRVERHPQYNHALFMFHDLTDAELAYCYQHAKALIFPSHAEGFGLPVVEALQYGLPVLASDIPIHREVGQDFCTYFDHRAPDALVQLVTDIEATGMFPPVHRADEFALPDWEASTREFLQQCLAACGQDAARPQVTQRAA